MAETPTTADPPFTSIRYLPTNEAYDKWADVYDGDGNFLQALDDLELKTLFPHFLGTITSPKPWRIVDLGCGTGRNTALLLGIPDAEIIALDASGGMLRVARARLQAAEAQGELSRKRTTLRLGVFDMLATSAPPDSVVAHTVDAVISTLVVEHVPLSTFFAHVAQLLRPGGVLLLTNMHSHMGGISQAGFVDVATGVKIRPTSYAHTVEDVEVEARRHGLEVEGDGGILERAVDEDMIETLGLRSGKWVGITCWFGGIFRRVN
ncbi:putative methyltransferase [Xylaria intraflava]|nr:putative methyltransferase [Xylaria intraflava]